MDFLRNDAERSILSRVRNVTRSWHLAESQITTDPVYPPNEHVVELYRNGLMSLAIPKAYGGLGCGLHGNVLVETFAVEEFASTCGVTSRWVHNHNEALGLLHTVGTPEQRQHFSQAVLDRHVQLAVSSNDLTLPPPALRLTAYRGTGGYVINGAIEYVAEAEDATWRINVVAVQEREEKTRTILAFIPRNYPGVHFHWSWDLGKPYQHTVSTISYNDCFVPDEYILGMPDHNNSFVADRSLWRAFSDVGWAAVYTGLARGASRTAQEKILTTRGYQRDNRIERDEGDPYDHWRITELNARIDCAHRLLYKAALAIEHAQAQPKSNAAAAGVAYRAKIFATEVVLATVGWLSQYQATHRVAENLEVDYLREAWSFVLQDAVPVD